MKALTIYQPWAWLIIDGAKRVENRSWRPSLEPGERFYIHAGKTRQWLHLRHDEATLREFPQLRDVGDFSFGAIIGTVEYVECVAMDDPKIKGGRGIIGPLCWRLANPLRLREPIPCRGNQGLWVPDVAVLAK